MSNNKYSLKCIDFILGQKVMTLATFSKKSTWSAPVYYFYLYKSFYFFSNSSSRHIQDSLEKKHLSSASIFEDPALFSFKPFDQIKGVQMSGVIEQAGKEKKAVKALVGYVKKFGIKKFIMDIENIDKSLFFFQTRFNAQFYKFVPYSVIYTDNSIEFGFKKEIKL